VYGYSVSYLTNGIDAFKYQAFLKPFMPKGLSAKVFRLSLMERKYNYFVLKLFVLQLTTIKRNDYAALTKLSNELGVLRKDSIRIYNLWMCTPHLRSRIKIDRSLIPKDLELSVKGLERTFCKEVYPVLVKTIKAVAYKRLRIFCKSSNYDMADMHNELTFKCIQTYYKLVPTEKTSLHVINYLKSTMENHAVNMIKTETTLKHGRLKSTKNEITGEWVSELFTVAENQMSSIGSDDMSGNSVDFSLQNQAYCSQDPTESLENEISVSTLLNKYNPKTKKYRLILILMGRTDDEFTLWLQSRKFCKYTEDNSDLQERCTTDEFNNYLSQFLHIDNTKLNVFLTQLAEKMSEKASSKRSILVNKQTYYEGRNSNETTSITKYVNSTHTYSEKTEFHMRKSNVK
jgi:hypothetical protein